MVFFDRGSWGKFVQGAVFSPLSRDFAARSTTPPYLFLYPLPLILGFFFDPFSRIRFFTSWLDSSQRTRSNPPPSSSSFPTRTSRPYTQYVHLMHMPHPHQTHGESRI